MWIDKKPNIDDHILKREPGWLRDLALNYQFFTEERDREVSRLKSGLVALRHQTTHLQRIIHSMRETKKKHEEQIPYLKEKKVELELELETIGGSLLVIFNAANSRPLDSPDDQAQGIRLIDRFRTVRLPASAATPKASPSSSHKATPRQKESSPRARSVPQPKPVKRGKPLHPPRLTYPAMSGEFPPIPTTTPTLQPLSMIRKPAAGSKAPVPRHLVSSSSTASNFCRVCSKVDFEGEGKGDPKTAPTMLECASCGGKYHMGCLDPPMLKKPPTGYVWTCVDCESGTSSIGEEEPDLEATTARTRSKTSSLPAAKKTFDEQLEEIETREIVEKFKIREKQQKGSRSRGSSSPDRDFRQ